MEILKWADKYSIDCRLKYGSVSTQNNYTSQVKSFLWNFKDEKEPKSISTEKIKLWILEKDNFSTRNHRLCAIKSFYELTVGMPVKLDKIPFGKREKKMPRLVNAELTREKILAISNKKHKAVLAIAFCCGLRVSEVVNIRISDINFEQGLILIRLGKGKKDRYVKVSESCIEIINDYISVFNPNEYLFNGQFSLQYTVRSCEEIYHKYIDTETSFHSLRHTQITDLIEKGTNLIAVQVASGHSRPSTTGLYYHASPKFLSQLPSPI